MIPPSSFWIVGVEARAESESDVQICARVVHFVCWSVPTRTFVIESAVVMECKEERTVIVWESVGIRTCVVIVGTIGSRTCVIDTSTSTSWEGSYGAVARGGAAWTEAGGIRTWYGLREVLVHKGGEERPIYTTVLDRAAGKCEEGTIASRDFHPDVIPINQTDIVRDHPRNILHLISTPPPYSTFDTHKVKLPSRKRRRAIPCRSTSRTATPIIITSRPNVHSSVPIGRDTHIDRCTGCDVDVCVDCSEGGLLEEEEVRGAFVHYGQRRGGGVGDE